MFTRIQPGINSDSTGSWRRRRTRIPPEMSPGARAAPDLAQVLHPDLGQIKEGEKEEKRKRGMQIVGGLWKEQGYRTIILKDGDTVANRVLTAAVKCT